MKKWISFNNGTKQIRKNQYIKAEIDNTQPNSKFMLCGDRTETVNDIISQYSKLMKIKYKTKQEWVGMWTTVNCARD